MKKTPNPRCKTIKENGQQCGAYAIAEHGYCISCARKQGLYQAKPKEAPQSEIDKYVVPEPVSVNPIVVAEPVALQALREQTEAEIARKPVDPRDKVAVVDQIRQLMQMAGLTGEEFSSLVGVNTDFQQKEVRVDAQRQRLIDRARALADGTSPQDRARAEQRAMADVQRVATSLRAQRSTTAMKLKSEPWVEVMGGELPEEFNVNGVAFIVPAAGLYRVPRTIAQMLSERRYRRQEKLAKSKLMSAEHPLEMGELNRKLREVEQQFGSITTEAEGDEFALAAEEIKPR